MGKIQVLEIRKVAYFSCIKKKKAEYSHPTTHYSYFGKWKPAILQQERENVKNLKEVEGKKYFKHLKNTWRNSFIHCFRKRVLSTCHFLHEAQW